MPPLKKTERNLPSFLNQVGNKIITDCEDRVHIEFKGKDLPETLEPPTDPLKLRISNVMKKMRLAQSQQIDQANSRRKLKEIAAREANI